MNKYLLRTVTILLVPCLIADPSYAAFAEGTPETFSQNNFAHDFTRQALVARIASAIFPGKGDNPHKPVHELVTPPIPPVLTGDAYAATLQHWLQERRGAVIIPSEDGEPFEIRYHRDSRFFNQNHIVEVIKDGKAIAYLHLHIDRKSKWAVISVAFTHSHLRRPALAVWDNFQARGLGGALMGVAMRIALLDGADMFRAEEVNAENAGFYERLGFKNTAGGVGALADSDFEFNLKALKNYRDFPAIRIKRAAPESRTLQTDTPIAASKPLLDLDPSKALASDSARGRVFALTDLGTLSSAQLEALTQGLVAVEKSIYIHSDNGIEQSIREAAVDPGHRDPYGYVIYFQVSHTGTVMGYAKVDDWSKISARLVRLAVLQNGNRSGNGRFILEALSRHWKAQQIQKLQITATFRSLGFYIRYFLKNTDCEWQGDSITIFPSTYGELTFAQKYTRSKILDLYDTRETAIRGTLANLPPGEYGIFYKGMALAETQTNSQGQWRYLNGYDLAPESHPQQVIDDITHLLVFNKQMELRSRNGDIVIPSSPIGVKYRSVTPTPRGPSPGTSGLGMVIPVVGIVLNLKYAATLGLIALLIPSVRIRAIYYARWFLDLLHLHRGPAYRLRDAARLLPYLKQLQTLKMTHLVNDPTDVRYSTWRKLAEQLDWHSSDAQLYAEVVLFNDLAGDVRKDAWHNKYSPKDAWHNKFSPGYDVAKEVIARLERLLEPAEKRTTLSSGSVLSSLSLLLLIPSFASALPPGIATLAAVGAWLGFGIVIRKQVTISIEEVYEVLRLNPHAWLNVSTLVSALNLDHSQATRRKLITAAQQLVEAGQTAQLTRNLQGSAQEFHFIPESLERKEAPFSLEPVFQKLWPRVAKQDVSVWPDWALFDWEVLKNETGRWAVSERIHIVIKLIAQRTGLGVINVNRALNGRIWGGDSYFYWTIGQSFQQWTHALISNDPASREAVRNMQTLGFNIERLKGAQPSPTALGGAHPQVQQEADGHKRSRVKLPWDRSHTGAQDPFYPTQRVRFATDGERFEQLAAGRPSIIDLGAGDGDSTDYLARENPHALIIPIDPRLPRYTLTRWKTVANIHPVKQRLQDWAALEHRAPVNRIQYFYPPLWSKEEAPELSRLMSGLLKPGSGEFVMVTEELDIAEAFQTGAAAAGLDVDPLIEVDHADLGKYIPAAVHARHYLLLPDPVTIVRAHKPALAPRPGRKFSIDPNTLAVSFLGVPNPIGVLSYMAVGVWKGLTRLARWLKQGAAAHTSRLLAEAA